MSDWDASDDEGAPATAPIASTSNVVSKKAAWADEEDLPDNEVKDSWEDSDEDEKPKPSTNGVAPIIRNKGSTKAKIAAKEAAEAQKLREIEERDNEDPLERKQREMEMQMNADLENARSLFGGASLADGTDAENADIFSLIANPKTKDDFEAISTALAKRVVDKYSAKPLYAHFIEHLARELCMPLKDLDVKKVSSTLAALGNEKQKQAKEGTGKKGGKGKAKPSLGAVAAGTKGGVTGRGYAADLDSHADALDNDYDDFM